MSRRLIVGLWVLGGGCTCALAHAPPPDGSPGDAGPVDPREGCLPLVEQDFPAWVTGQETRGTRERLRDCSVALNALADGLGVPAYTCIEGLIGCQVGDDCRDDPIGLCFCGGESCGSGQVCVRSASGEAARCVDVCVHEGPVPRTCGEPGPVPPAQVNPMMSPAMCDDFGRRRCRLWAQLFAPEGWAHASCVAGAGDINCGMGDTCVAGDTPERPRCDCSGAECALDEVCVSDTPGGVPRCERACIPPI